MNDGLGLERWPTRRFEEAGVGERKVISEAMSQLRSKIDEMERMEEVSELKDIYIVGCGPSMRNFPWNYFKGLITIAVNGAIRDVPQPTYFLTACSAFGTNAAASRFWNVSTHKVLVIREDHQRYASISPYLEEYDEVIPPARFDGRIGFTWDEFATGQNSGFCALQYAVLLGFQRIHLIGFDLLVDQNSRHYYNNSGPNARMLHEFFIHFRTAIRILQMNGYELFSHTERSRLNELIPYVRIIGDVR